VAHYNPLDAQSDPFRPPEISTLVECLHCGEEYDSYRIEWRVEQDDDGKPHGFWCCPIEGCGGKGFGIDIFPVDPDYQVDEDRGWSFVEDEEELDEEDFSDEEFDDELDDMELSADGDDVAEDAPYEGDDDAPW
jgi:hypothetical protein